MPAVAMGALLLCVSCALWGYERSRQEKERLLLLSELVSLIKHIEVHIRTMRTPLLKIYEEFYGEALERAGFCLCLRTKGIESAAGLISDKLPSQAAEVLRAFCRDIGNGYEKEQCELCQYTVERLSAVEERLSDELSGRLRLYRLLPLLLAASVIILLI